ncbi:hypothetical protein GSI01S_10_02270 [Gordonia sihwensis NBRC 108236]|uniref:Uncharacterized protein n=2 Tax=Gordoniaceae TaxID=85026 RepID=L7LID2_9ACTN|nr:hypothetical protein GSI01S_10_02270 [Gordonia sihwensis NBRC 108236]
MRANYRRRGPCHPWCGTADHVVGRAREKRIAASEIATETALPGHIDDPICPVSGDICDDCMAC